MSTVIKYLITQSEAARILGVSRQRVRQLVDSGQLRVAATVAGAKLLDSRRVSTFAAKPRQSGRPANKIN